MKKLGKEQIAAIDVSELPQTRIPPPKDIKRDDIRALFKIFSITTFLRAGDIRRTLPHIYDDERLFYIKPSRFTITNKDGGGSIKEYGVIFFTDRRVLFVTNSGRPIEDIALYNIYSVASQKTGYVKGQLSFCTDKKRADFEVSSSEAAVTLQLVEATLVRIVAEFGPALYLAKLQRDEDRNATIVTSLENSIANKAKTVSCPGCAAQSIIIPGLADKCEYCGRVME